MSIVRTPNLPTHNHKRVQFMLSLLVPGSHSSNLLMHCCNTVYLYTCYCNAVFIGLISGCCRPLNSLHCLLLTPIRLTACNLMLSTGVVQLCPTVAPSLPTSCQQAHLITPSDIGRLHFLA